MHSASLVIPDVEAVAHRVTIAEQLFDDVRGLVVIQLTAGVVQEASERSETTFAIPSGGLLLLTLFSGRLSSELVLGDDPSRKQGVRKRPHWANSFISRSIEQNVELYAKFVLMSI